MVKLQPRTETEDESDTFGMARGEFSSEGVSTHREVRTYPVPIRWLELSYHIIALFDLHKLTQQDMSHLHTHTS